MSKESEAEVEVSNSELARLAALYWRAVEVDITATVKDQIRLNRCIAPAVKSKDVRSEFVVPC